MKIATRRKTRAYAGFEDEYRSCLRQYLTSQDETALGRAYELGRRALREKMSLLEIASLHHEAVLAVVRDADTEKYREELLRAGATFFAECLSPYEMAQRGFQDGVKALRQLNETLEEEIKRIAYAVHDEAGQLLVAVHLALAEIAPELPESQQGHVAHIKELLNQVEKHLRRYSHELRPTILDDLGWIPAIRFLAEGISKRAGLAVFIEATDAGRLPGTVETTLYRVVQEALTNAVKHAKAANVWIQARRDNSFVCLSIRDDGKGFKQGRSHAPPGHKGLGLIAMQERLTAIGGTLHIRSNTENGTELSIRVPVEAEHANSHRASR